MDDTEKARHYAMTNFGINSILYSAYLDGRLSLRKELEFAQKEVQCLKDALKESIGFASCAAHEDLIKKWEELLECQQETNPDVLAGLEKRCKKCEEVTHEGNCPTCWLNDGGP